MKRKDKRKKKKPMGGFCIDRIKECCLKWFEQVNRKLRRAFAPWGPVFESPQIYPVHVLASGGLVLTV